MSLLSHASQEKFSQGIYSYTPCVLQKCDSRVYACKPIAIYSLNCSCSSFFLTVCTRAWKAMLIQQYTGLLCKPVIVFAMNIVLQNLFAEIMYSNFTQIQMLRKVYSTERNSSECSGSSFEICLYARCHLHNCILVGQICSTSPTL